MKKKLKIYIFFNLHFTPLYKIINHISYQQIITVSLWVIFQNILTKIQLHFFLEFFLLFVSFSDLTHSLYFKLLPSNHNEVMFSPPG